MTTRTDTALQPFARLIVTVVNAWLDRRWGGA